MNEKFTTEELLIMLADSLDNPLDSESDAKMDDDLFIQLSKVDGFHQYLKDTMNRDILRYFKATTDQERENIRGAFNRTSYLKSRMTKADKFANSKKL